MKVGILILLYLSLSVVTFSQDKKEKILLLPFNSIGIDTISIKTAENLLKFDLTKYEKWETVSSSKNCTQDTCAINLGKQYGTQKVFVCTLSRLGEKIIVQYLLIDVPNSKVLLSDNTSALSIEDLENVMKRIAASITKQMPIDKTAEVGTVTEKETVPELRRSAQRTVGFSFGYLFPTDGYDNADRSFAFEFRTGFETEMSAIGLMLAVQRGFVANIYGSYLFSREDICPYIGGAFGFHWVTHNTAPVYTMQTDGQYSYQNGDKKDNGFEFTVNTGFRLFHTYDFQILLNLDYTITLNDYNDKALIFTIGVLW